MVDVVGGPGDQLRRHAVRYAAAHGGRDPYTDAWTWAEAIVTWRQSWPGGTWRRRVDADAIGRDLVLAGVAESIRLMMGARMQPVGDLPLELLRGELRLWLYDGVEFPAPGSPQWPAPAGPYADRWRTLMEILGGEDDQGKRIVRVVTEFLAALGAFGTQTLARTSSASDSAAMDYRISHGDHQVALADVAPAIGIPPGSEVPVGDPLRYVGVTGLTPVRAAV